MIENNTKTIMIREMPDESKPMEKCLKLGPEILTDTELLACIIRTGTKDCSVLSLAKQIMYYRKDTPGLLGACRMSAQDFQSIRGIGRVKSVQLQCIFELARRIHKQNASFSLDITNPETVADYYMEDMRHEEQELLLVLFLDTKNKLLGESVLYKGTVKGALVSPREIYIEALRFHAVSIVLLHNHPSGDPTPSNEDKLMTAKVQGAGRALDIPLLDHIVIGDNSFVSFHEKGYL